MEIETILPELVLAAAATVSLFLSSRKALWLGVGGLTAAIVLVTLSWGEEISGGFIIRDNFSWFFNLIFLGSALLVLLASRSDLILREREYPALIIFSTIGMTLLSSSNDLVSIMLSLELTSIPLYVMAGLGRDKKSAEASLKYALLGILASAVLIFGMVFVFGFTGETALPKIAQAVSKAEVNPGLIAGLFLMIGGFGFKIAALPFHMWAPDVYEGAPTEVTTFLSTASKAAGLAVLVRILSAFEAPVWLDWGMVLAILSALGMTIGNLVAIHQTNIKRMLAYSGIAHTGYILIGVASLGMDGAALSNTIFYIVAFALSDMASFLSVIAISSNIGSDDIADYAGIARHSPLVALVISLGLISLAGIPLTAGFLAKLYIFTGALDSGLSWLVIVAIINTVISAYYYFKVIKVMWFDEPLKVNRVTVSFLLGLALLVSSAGILVMGIAPSLIMNALGQISLPF